MFRKPLLAVVGGVIALVIGAASPVAAQDAPPTEGRTSTDEASGSIRGERVIPGRIGGTAAERRRQREQAPRASRTRQQQPPAALTPEQIRAEAEQVLAAAGSQCQVTEAIHPGLINDAKVFEVACANAPGRILIASTPPQAFDCLELAGAAAIARASDAAADVGQQCTLPANNNAVAVIGGFAREAGVTCTVDEAVVIGRAGDNMVYEVGCAGVDGYRIERTAAGWDPVDCLQVASVGETCRFTTVAEQNATLKAQLAGTEAAACDVAQVRLMGQNPNGRFFEVKCAAEGEGYIARIKDGAAQQIYPCATAQRIGGGCTLTAVPAAAPAE